MGRRQYLEKRIRDLGTDLERTVASLEDIRERIRKADERRRNEREDKDKWNIVLENLEAELDRAKAHLVKCEVEKEEKKKN